MPTLKKQEVASPLYETAEKFLSKKERVKTLNKEIAPLQEQLKNAVTKKGTVKDEEKGHQTLVLNGDGDNIVLTNTCKVSTILKPSALEVIKSSLTPQQVKQVVEKIEVVRTDVLEQLIQEGKIKAAVVKKLFTTEDNYSFSAAYEKKPKKKPIKISKRGSK